MVTNTRKMVDHKLHDSPISPPHTSHRPAVIKDARGQPLFSIKHKLIAIHSTYLGVHPQSNETLFTVKSGFSFGTKLTATFRNLAGGAGGQEEELILRGDMLDRSAEIMTKQGVVVARISRSFLNMGEMFCESSRLAYSSFLRLSSCFIVFPVRPIFLLLLCSVAWTDPLLGVFRFVFGKHYWRFILLCCDWVEVERVDGLGRSQKSGIEREGE
jgi:hypothetical protein